MFYFGHPRPEVIKLLSVSTYLGMNIFQLINVKMPTIVEFWTSWCKSLVRHVVRYQSRETYVFIKVVIITNLGQRQKSA